MEFKHLESFIEVINQKSFSKAAHNLYLTQPAISAQVASLEKELQVKLLVRNSKNVILTKEGRIFYRYAYDIVRKREAAIQAVHGNQTPQTYVIVIGATRIPARFYLPLVIEEYQKKYRNDSFRIYTGDSYQVIRQVAAEKVEIGITSIPVPHTNCNTETMAYDRWVIITPNKARFCQKLNTGDFSPKDLLSERFICHTPEFGSRKDVNVLLQQLGIDTNGLNIIAEVDDTDTIIEMVYRGLGVSIVSRHAASASLKRGEILCFDLAQKIFPREIYISYSKNCMLSPSAKRFYNFTLNFYQPERTLPRLAAAASSRP